MIFCVCICFFYFFFFQAEDGIRDLTVTGVQTCALPIYRIDHDIDLVALAQGVECREGNADLGPKPSKDELLARPVRSTAARKSGSSHEFIVVRSISGTPGSAWRNSGLVPDMPCLT